MTLRSKAPAWGRAPSFALLCMCALALPARAQPRPHANKPDRPPPAKAVPQATEAAATAGKPARKDDKDGKDGNKKGPVKTFDFTALDLAGRMRSPQLLYFLERASEELERASLEKRSFIPHLVRSLEEEAL